NQPIQLRQLDEAKKNRFLVGIGGGKDSIVSVEILKEQKKQITGFILDSQDSPPQIQINVAKTMEINYLIVKRQLDSQLFDLKSTYNGHIPITAIYSFIALLLAIIYDYSSIIIPNGKSANFGNVNYLGVEINHQWSKSEEFEKLFQEYVKQNITLNIDYSSNLRPYSEMEIARMFSSHNKYFPVFSSCNKNFKIKENVNQKRWCGECAKCAFVFIILAANLPKEEVVKIFDKNLLNDSKLIPLYQDLIGKGKMKPFDCVGTFEESRQALEIIKNRKEFDVSKII
ncbi:MAG: endonuclease domain-containing protein, partial [Patescibacteria group bacterium]